MMARLTMYTATCWREGTSWTVHIAQLDRTTWAARLSDVDAAARRLIAGITGPDPDTVEVVVDLRVPDGITRLLDAAAAARQESDLISVEAVALRRSLARRLTEHGYGVRDIAVLLGVSYARAKQLTGDPLGSAAAVAVSRAHRGYQHEAFLYRNDDEFLTGTVSFIQDAVTLGQPVMVALAKPRMQMLQATLGTYDGEVRYVDLDDVGANPARIVPVWLDFIAQNAGRPIRGISEPQWPGRRPEEVVECQLHEGLLNVAIDPDIPLWLRCPYAAAELPDSIAQAALESHPALVEVSGNRGTSYRGSTSYGGLHHVDSIFRSELPPAPSDCALIRFGPSDLGVVRAHVSGFARGAGLGSERSRSLTHAMSEIAASAIQLGGGLGELRIWIQPNALVCQITGQGEWDPLVGGRTPATREEENRGLWLANQISDLVQIRSTPRGSTARVFAWL